MGYIINLVAVALVFLGATYFLPGIKVAGFWTAVFAAFMLSIMNIFIKPILIILTLPVNVLTLGLFTFVINASLILLVGNMVSGFSVDGFFPALGLALIISVVKTILNR